nr:MAG TPA: Glutaredoxin arsenate reductase [Caudoviricetes sp.]
MQNTAFHGSLRGEKTMIRVLFVCHGRIYCLE